MNSRTVIIATIACAVLGCWLPSLWLPGPVEKVRSILPPPATAHGPAWQSLQGKVRGAGTSMQQFQAVMAGVRGRGAALAFHTGDMGDLLCEEAEELAARLAGEELGAHVTDGAAFIKSLRDCNSYVTDAALEAWADADPDAALRGLIADASDTHGVADTLIQRIAARDPDKALAILRASPVSPSQSSARNEVWTAVLAACAEKGPDYALAAIQSAPRQAKDAGLYSLLSKMAAEAPHAALAWVEGLPPELKKLTDDSVIMDIWGETDPAAALADWGQKRPGLGVNDPVGRNLANQWAAKDPEAFLQWATAQGESGTPFLRIAAREIASRDPQRAAAMADRMPAVALPRGDPNFPPDDSEANTELRDLRWAIGNEWAQKDPAAALAWAKSLPSAGERAYVYNGMRAYLSELPKEERLAIARELGTGTNAGFQTLWEVDRAEAGKVFASLPAEEKLGNFSTMQNGLTAESPAAAAGLLEGIIQDIPDTPEGTQQSSSARNLSRYVAEVTSAWAGRDPAAAAAWVRQLPPGESQAIAAANIALTWGRYDLPAARAWAEKLPAGASRDKAARQLAILTAASGAE